MSDQINVNQLSNALQQKVDLPSGKSQADIDYVVEWQAPTSANNYTWYRLYKSGWIEQGGLAVYNQNPTTINLPITMADTNYTALAIHQRNADAGAVWQQINTKTVSSFITGGYYASGSAGTADTNRRINWEVKGFAAQS